MQHALCNCLSYGSISRLFRFSNWKVSLSGSIYQIINVIHIYLIARGSLLFCWMVCIAPWISQIFMDLS